MALGKSPSPSAQLLADSDLDSASFISHATSLVFEQQLLAPESAAVARQRPVGAYHAMARHDDRHPVVAVGSCGGARSIRPAHPPRELLVADSPAGRDFPQRRPDLTLEVRSREAERNPELAQLPGKVVLQFRVDLSDVVVVAGCDRAF